jgi:pimeloyl-ACP methyl ester carboxylesterase
MMTVPVVAPDPQRSLAFVDAGLVECLDGGTADGEWDAGALRHDARTRDSATQVRLATTPRRGLTADQPPRATMRRYKPRLKDSSAVDIVRGTAGRYPFASIGDGPPLVVFAGLSPSTGVRSNVVVQGAVGPVTALAITRRVVVFNRRPRLPRGMTMAELAAEHADALAETFALPLDLIGESTGGSIAQQLAADRPEVVARLVLASTACRLGPLGRDLQRKVGQAVRAGQHRRALAVAAASLVPPHRGQGLAAAVGWLSAGRVVKDDGDWADLATTIEAEDDFDLAHCAAPIQARTLIVGGAQDRFYSPSLFAETARLVPNSRLRLVESRGHITVLRDPLVRREIAEFLRLPSTR